MQLLVSSQMFPRRQPRAACAWQGEVRKQKEGTFLAVQWLRLHLPKQGVWVRSLVKELRSHRHCGQKTKTVKQKQYCNKFNKDLNNGPDEKISLLRKRETERRKRL